MICYKDRTFCASEVEEHTCGREITPKEIEEAKELGLPIAYGNFCEEKVCEKCGGELSSKLVGDESYDYCTDCNHVTH